MEEEEEEEEEKEAAARLARAPVMQGRAVGWAGRRVQLEADRRPPVVRRGLGNANPVRTRTGEPCPPSLRVLTENAQNRGVEKSF